MLKEHSSFFRRVMIVTDLGIITVAFIVGYFIRNYSAGLNDFYFYLPLLPLMLVVWGGLLYCFGMYHSFRVKRLRMVFWIIVRSTIIGFFIFASFLFVFKIEGISRAWIGLSFVMGSSVIGIEKIFVICIFRYFRDKGWNFRNILVVGTGRRAVNMIQLINRHREWGLRIVGLVDDEEEKIGQVIEGHKVLGLLKDIQKIVHNNVVDEVIFIVPDSWLRRIEDVVLICETEGVKVNLAVDLYEPEHFKIKLGSLYQLPVLTFARAPIHIGNLFLKRAFDVMFSFVMLTILFPAFFIVSICVKLTSKGPVFFRQERCGFNGRRFILYKFRTMVKDAAEKLEELRNLNEMEGPAFKLKNDPRVTSIGKILRKTSLDELPQLWNILKGDMSLVGPRPPLPEEVVQYDSWHRRRLRMRPGLTCLWQVSGRNNITDFDQWAKLDMEYIDHWGLWLDVRIVLKTFPVVLFGIGAK